jgi:hypothetical protein
MALDALQEPIPLSPFMWDAPRQAVAPIGWGPGRVSDLLSEMKDLSLRLDHIAGEMEGPYYHPVRTAYSTHPLHTTLLSKHQFDVLRYGMILDQSQGLVLVEIPRRCGDMGKVMEVSSTVIFGQNEERPHPPLVAEYAFVVYKIHKQGPSGLHATPLFRLLFRNEAISDSNLIEQAKHFPMYGLAAVFISNEKFYNIHEVICSHRKYHTAPLDPTSGVPVADPRLLAELQRPEVVALCDAWIQVLEGIIPTRNSTAVAALETLRVDDAFSPRRVTAPVPQLLRHACNRPPLQYRPRISYITGDRMRRRIVVTQKSRNLIAEWRDGSLDLHYYASEVGDKPELKNAECVRVLLRETRNGHNFIQEKELSAFLPQESDTERLKVYSSLAAERLRLWVLRALLTAELNDVHVLLMELDTSLIVGQCVGLLGGSQESHSQNVLFHVCKIFIETVEDFLQHSGQLWRVTISVAESDANASITSLCSDILECIQLAKHRVELDLITPTAVNLRPEAEAAEGPQLRIKGSESAASPRHSWHVPPSENIIFYASTTKLPLTDQQIYPLFKYCDINNNSAIPVSELVKLFLCKDNKITRHNNTKLGRYNPPLSEAEALRMQASNLIAHPLCALDGCGLPFDETSIGKFVQAFSRRCSADGEPTLNYLEFSTMMLSLAKR